MANTLGRTALAKVPVASRDTKASFTLTLAAALLAGLALLFTSTAAQAAGTTSNLGAYTGAANPDGISSFGSWAGTSVGYAEDFFADDSWSTIESPMWWLEAWRGKPYRMVFGVPIIPATGGSLAEGASGAYNEHFKTLAQNLVAGGQGNAILRLGWEFGGGWYRWTVKTPADAANYAAYWRQIVTTMRAVAPDLAFDWNPIWGRQPVDPATAYPGDAYVTYIGIDVYDQSWASGWEDPLKRWADFRTTQWGLDWHRSFAAAHGKRMSFPEWGLTVRDDGHGGGDNPYFVQMMKDWIARNNVEYHVYFQYNASDGKHDLQSGLFPLGANEFKKSFGASGSPAPSPVSTDSIAPTIEELTPSPAAAGVELGPRVTVTFSEAIDPATLSKSTFKIATVGKKRTLGASITYDRARMVATLTPSTPLKAGTSYTATLVGGSGGVKDLAGNTLDANVKWTFETQKLMRLKAGKR